MKTVFSGIQPTGEMHLGNYVGAIRNWVKLQDEYRCIFCVVDYHAITQSYSPKEMRARVFDMCSDILALGVDPEKSILFLQSMVPEHTELCWVFDSIAGQGDLERMTQFKDKAASQPDHVNVALFNYPVLQAADILLYHAELVPVGEDQRQHLELTHRIARSFNHTYAPLFKEPQMLATEVPKLLGIDGEAKMSKSKNNTIPLAAFGNPKQLKKLISACKTDTKRVTREDAGNPDDCPTIAVMHKAFSSAEDNAWVRQGCTTAGIGCGDCKGKLIENMTAHFAPYVARKKELVENPKLVSDALARGAAKAREIATKTIGQVHDALGLWRP